METMEQPHLKGIPRRPDSAPLLVRRKKIGPSKLLKTYTPRNSLQRTDSSSFRPVNLNPVNLMLREKQLANSGMCTPRLKALNPAPSSVTDSEKPFYPSIAMGHQNRIFSKAELDIWGPQNSTREDPRWQRRKREIVRKLLRNFSLKKTIEKYESVEPMEYRLDPRCFSIQCAAESEVIRKRMLYLMGTDVCRINDKRFIERLQIRVQDEYEREQEIKERQLAEKERLRQRRLISDGVVTAEQLREHDSTKNRNKRRTRTPPPGEETDRKLVQEKPRPVTYKEEKKDKHKGSKEEENNKTKEEGEDDGADSEEKADDEKPEGNGEDGENGDDGKGAEGNGDNGNGVDEHDGYGAHKDDEDEGWHCDSDRPNYKARNDDPLIRRMRHQETTDGIYHTAKEVLMGDVCGGECEFK